MKSNEIDKIKEYVPENSIFFPLYATDHPKLETLLDRPGINNCDPLDYSTALRIYLISTGWNSLHPIILNTNTHGTSLFYHLLNKNGPKNDNQHSDTTVPSISAKHLIESGMRLKIKTLNKLGWLIRHNGQCGVIDKNDIGGRISLAFYTAEKGKLAARIGNDKEKMLGMFMEYLSVFDDVKNQFRYISGILKDRLTYLNSMGIYQEKGKHGKAFSVKKDFTIDKKTKIRVLLNKAKKLGLIPVYLMPPADNKELNEKKELLIKHMEESYSNESFSIDSLIDESNEIPLLD